MSEVHGTRSGLKADHTQDELIDTLVAQGKTVPEIHQALVARGWKWSVGTTRRRVRESRKRLGVALVQRLELL
jgi:hypothetical protein